MKRPITRLLPNVILALAALGGCAERGTETVVEGRHTSSNPSQGVSSTPIKASPPNPDVVQTRDQCGANQLQWLVGRQVGDVPPYLSRSPTRIACTTCAITEDFSPQRLNIFFDEVTRTIREVRCG